MSRTEATKRRPELIGAREETYVATDRSRDWMDDGLCHKYDPELWFPVSAMTPTMAYSVCMTCPVQMRCLDYAWNNGVAWGIWGGMTATERYEFKVRHKLPFRWRAFGVLAGIENHE